MKFYSNALDMYVIIVNLHVGKEKEVAVNLVTSHYRTSPRNLLLYLFHSRRPFFYFYLGISI